MKTLYISILSGLFTFSLSAQLTQAINAPAPGDYRQMYRCDTVSPGNSGSGQVWDFSAISTHSSIVLTYSTIPGTFTDFPGSTIAAITGTDASYYDSDVNSLRFYGGNFGVGSGFTAVVGGLVYTSSAIRAAYPMSFNTSSTSAIAGSIVVTSPISTSGTFTGTSHVIADGTGTLILPGSGNTFTNVLRVVTSQTVDFTTQISDGKVILQDFDYYVIGSKFPFISIATATANTALGNTTQTIVTRDKSPGVTAIQTNGSISNASFWNVYPNPANTYVNFSSTTNSVVKLSVFDITGKLVAEQNSQDGNIKLEVSGLSQGLYLYKIQDANQSVLKSGKLTVSH